MVAWSDLPSDILRCVAARLELVDQIRFRAVCQSWRKVEEVKPNDKLPWVFTVNESAFRESKDSPNEPHYYLHDVKNRKGYGFLIHCKSTVMSLRGLRSFHIAAIKLGWMLLNFEGRLLLFNPFTQQIIHAPELRKPSLFLFTFRYCSKSRRLVVYAANRSTASTMLIKVWKSGDQEWESNNFEAEFPDLMETIIKIQLVDQTLYCIFQTGVVSSFNDSRKSWGLVVKYLEDDNNELFPVRRPKFDMYCRTFEFRGQLFMINLRTFWNLWRMDQSKGCWVEVVEFHNCTIFCSIAESHSDLCLEEFILDSNPAVTNTLVYYPQNNVQSFKIVFNLQRMNIQFPSHIQTNHWIEPGVFYVPPGGD